MIGAIVGAFTTLLGVSTMIAGAVVYGAGTADDNPAGTDREPRFLASGGVLFVGGWGVAALGLLLLVGGVAV